VGRGIDDIMRDMSLLDELKAEVARCERCPELVACRSRTVFGDGNARSGVVMIGEAPGADEDKQGIPFVGRAGKLLTEALKSVGIDRRHYYITNMLKCRPPENRDPSAVEMSNCKGFLAAQMALLKPKILVTLGRISMNELYTKKMTITQLHGRQSTKMGGIIYFPMYHPSWALRGPQNDRPFRIDIAKFKKLLEREGLV
jgi:uracil-DNA glycosylase family 4